MRQINLLIVTVTAIVALTIRTASADQPNEPSSKGAVPLPDAVPPLILTTKPRKDAAEMADPVPDLLKRIYQSWPPALRLTLAPYVRESSAAATPIGNLPQSKPKLPEPPAPLVPLDLPAKPPL